MSDLVEGLRESIIAEAHGDGRISDGALCERLIRERHAAADEIERLRSELSAARNAALEKAAKVAEMYVEKAWPAADIAADIRELRDK